MVHGLDHEREAVRPVVAPAGDQPDADRVAAGHEPVAVVLDLVKSSWRPDGGRSAGEGRQGSMKRRTGIGGYIAAVAVGIEPAEDERKE